MNFKPQLYLVLLLFTLFLILILKDSIQGQNIDVITITQCNINNILKLVF